MGISLYGGRYGRGGITGGGYLHILPPKHSRTVYFDLVYYIPVTGYRVEAGVKGGEAVMGSGQTGFIGNAGGGSGGEIDRGRERIDGTETDTDTETETATETEMETETETEM